MSNSKITMKLLIDKSKRKVLFAEGEKDCVDFFFHLLSYPIGTIILLLIKETMLKSIGNLRQSLENLGTDYVEVGSNKDCLLNPKPVPVNPFFYTHYQRLILNRDEVIHNNFTDATGVTCPDCKSQFDQTLTYVSPAGVKKNHVGYVKDGVNFMIMDDLCVKPMCTISNIVLFNKFNVHDVSLLEEREVTLDMDLGVELLKASILSKTVLTDVFLSEKA